MKTQAFIGFWGALILAEVLRDNLFAFVIIFLCAMFFLYQYAKNKE